MHVNALGNNFDVLEQIITEGVPKIYPFGYLNKLSLVCKYWRITADKIKFTLLNNGTLEIRPLGRSLDGLTKTIHDKFYNNVRKLSCLRVALCESFERLDLFIEKLKAKCPELNLLYDGATDDVISHLKSYPYSNLYLEGGGYTSNGFREVAALTSLTSLSFIRCSLTDNDFQELTTLQKLTSLDIFCEKLSSLEGITKFSNLIDLSLSNSPITDVGIKNICNQTILTKLKIYRCKNLTSNGLNEITKLVNLTALDIIPADNKSKIAVHTVIKLKNLKNLDMRYCDLTDSNVYKKLITNLVNLTTLNICNKTNYLIDDESALVNLSDLSFSHCCISDEGFNELTKLVNITTLNFSETFLTGRNLKEITKMTNLTALSFLNCTSISDEGFNGLDKLSNLKDLNISYCNVTDTGLKKVFKLVNLTALDIYECSNITDNGFKEITSLVNLTDLGIDKSIKLSQDSINWLFDNKNMHRRRFRNIYK